jgi:hypothetical protein
VADFAAVITRCSDSALLEIAVLMLIEYTDFRKQRSGRFALGEDDDAVLPIAEITGIRAAAFRSKCSQMLRFPIHGNEMRDEVRLSDGSETKALCSRNH